jgi:hypothetical protein
MSKIMPTKKVFLDKVNKCDIKAGDKARLKECPYPDGCMPVDMKMGNNSQGYCCGLIYKSDNLDCIRFCEWYIVDNEQELLERFMTPNEAISQAKALLTAVSTSLWSNSEYRHHWDLLCRRRNRGDKSPSELK